jgi:hypothetical protein
MVISTYRYDLFKEKLFKLTEQQNLGFSTLDAQIELLAIVKATDDELDEPEAMSQLKKEMKRLPKNESETLLSSFFDEWISFSKAHRLLPTEFLNALEAARAETSQILGPIK